MPPRRTKPEPTRSLVVELPEPELLRLVRDARAAGETTHDYVRKILTERRKAA